jgi:hypothetical protein
MTPGFWFAMNPISAGSSAVSVADEAQYELVADLARWLALAGHSSKLRQSRPVTYNMPQLVADGFATGPQDVELDDCGLTKIRLIRSGVDAFQYSRYAIVIDPTATMLHR